MCILPNEDAVIRLLGESILEQNDERAVNRRYMGVESNANLGRFANITSMLLAAE